jgi:hypothetical protein
MVFCWSAATFAQQLWRWDAGGFKNITAVSKVMLAGKKGEQERRHRVIVVPQVHALLQT